MNRFAVRQQDDSKIPPAGLRDLTPAPNPTVGLNLFLYRGSPRAFDPDILDCSTVGPSSHRIKIRGGLHMAPSGRSALFHRGRTRGTDLRTKRPREVTRHWAIYARPVRNAIARPVHRVADPTVQLSNLGPCKRRGLGTILIKRAS